MIFMQYIRPNARKRIVDIPMPPYTEFVANKLIELGYEFQLEHVPSYHQIFLTAGKRENGQIDQDYIQIVKAENKSLFDGIIRLIDDIIDQMNATKIVSPE